MRLSRMTTRRWMIAVAVVGLLLGVVDGGRRLKQRQDYCLQQASGHARMETFFRSMESGSAARPPPQRPAIIVDGHAYQAATLVACFAGLTEPSNRPAAPRINCFDRAVSRRIEKGPGQWRDQLLQDQ
jgi:hypothetical protein